MEILKRENYPAAPFDAKVGRSPMVKIGNMVFIGGTSSTNVHGEVEGGGDPYTQTKIILKKINALLKHSGGSRRHVVRVRFYVTDITYGRECLKAYAESFKAIRVDFLEVLADKNSVKLVDKILEELGRCNFEPLIVFNGDPDSIFANHSLNLSGVFNDARQKINSLIVALMQG